jgi:replication fork protection complex subunit Tof1/Swi1
LFKSIMDEEKSLPREQPYKDLVALINYILRRFFKAVEEDNFLIIEAFYPKNRGKWKALSSWEPPVKGVARSEDETILENKWPAEARVKKGYTWSEQLGIAIKCLVEDEKEELVNWIKEVHWQLKKRQCGGSNVKLFLDLGHGHWPEEAYRRGHRRVQLASH